MESTESSQRLIKYPVCVNWYYSDATASEPGPGPDPETESDTDEMSNLSVDSPKFKFLNLFAVGTLQKIPKRLVGKKYSCVLYIGQFLLLLAAFAFYLHVLGVFKEKTLIEEELGLTLTTFKNIVWNLRNPIFTVLGTLYFRKMHLDTMLSSLRLTSSYLRSVKRKIELSCVLVILFTVVLPACAKLVQMLLLPTVTEKNNPFSPKQAIRNTVLLVLARLLALPIVFALITVFYLLYYQVRQHKMKIQAWKVKRGWEARNHFLDIQAQNKRAEKAFQSFLIIHIAILILIFVPGVLCYVERFKTEGSYTKTSYTEGANKMFDPVANLVDSARLSKNPKLSHLANLTREPNPIILVFNIPRRMPNKTEETGQQQLAKKHTKTSQDRKAQARIGLEALTFLGELLALYLPIVLLGKINQTLLQIPETIRSLQFDQQRDNGYLVQNPETVKEMLKDYDHPQELQILGIKLTIVKAVLIALLAPLFTLLFHILVRHVDMSP